MIQTLPQLITAEEFAVMQFENPDALHELVRGEVIEMSRPQGKHAYVLSNIAGELRNHVKPRKLGWVVSDGGVILERNPDTVRGPDVAFYSKTRHPEYPDAFFDISPDLAVEIRSPNDRDTDIRGKIREYIQASVRIVWKVEPDDRTVTVYTGNMRGVEYGEEDTITGGDVLPEFSCAVREFFE